MIPFCRVSALVFAFRFFIYLGGIGGLVIVLFHRIWTAFQPDSNDSEVLQHSSFQSPSRSTPKMNLITRIWCVVCLTASMSIAYDYDVKWYDGMPVIKRILNCSQKSESIAISGRPFQFWRRSDLLDAVCYQ